MKKPSLRIIFFYMGLISIVIPFNGNAQPFVDVLNLKYRWFPANAPAENNGSRVTGSLEEVTFLLPIVTKSKNVILIGGDYSGLNFHASGPASPIYSLHSASLQLGFDQQLKNPAWRRTFLFLPKLNGDFKGLSKSFQPGGVLMYTYKKNDNLKYHFGFYYNRECFGDYYIPLLGIDWKINSSMNLFGDLPNNLSFEIKISHVMTIGTGFTSTISSFRIHSQDVISYIREGDNVLGHDQVKIYLNYYISKNIVLFGETGQTINRKYTSYDNNGKTISSANIPTMDGIFLAGGVAYRFAVE